MSFLFKVSQSYASSTSPTNFVSISFRLIIMVPYLSKALPYYGIFAIVFGSNKATLMIKCTWEYFRLEHIKIFICHGGRRSEMFSLFTLLIFVSCLPENFTR